MHILNISGQLSKKVHNEQVHMAGFFEREVARIESIRESLAAAAVSEAAMSADDEGAEDAQAELVGFVIDEKEEERYHQMELEFLERFGLLEEEDAAGMPVGVGA